MNGKSRDAAAKQYSHMLTMTLPEGMSEENFLHASEEIKTVLDGKSIFYEIGGRGGFQTCIVWRYSHQTQEKELVYLTDVQGILGDKAVYLHTQRLIKSMNISGAQVVISKPLTKKIDIC